MTIESQSDIVALQRIGRIVSLILRKMGKNGEKWGQMGTNGKNGDMEKWGLEKWGLKNGKKWGLAKNGDTHKKWGQIYLFTTKNAKMGTDLFIRVEI